jgi:hypothetical protein
MEGSLDAATAAGGAGQLSPDGRWRWTGQQWVPSAPLAKPWRWPELNLRRAADTTALLSAAAAGFSFDLAIQSGSVGIGVTGWVLVMVMAMIASRRLSTRSSVVAVLIAGLMAPWFSLRTSPWLILPDALVTAVAIGAGVLLSVQGSPWHFPVRSTAERIAQAVLHMMAAPAFVAAPMSSLLRRLDAGKRRSATAGLRGVLIAVPIVITLGLLLSSADPIFASFFNIQWDLSSLLGHAFWVLVGTLLTGGLLRAASSAPAVDLEGAGFRLGATEGLTVLLSLVMLFGAFAVAQVVGMAGAGGTALRAAGITYSDYARTGFFQLLWVAGLTAVVLVTLRNVLTQLEGWRRMAFVILTESAIVLILLVVAVAVQRLGLYESAYGLTMLRLYCTVFAAWVALIFVALGIAVWRWSRNQWLYTAAFLSGAAIVLGLNLVNPEALVVRWNASRVGYVSLDAAYLTQLSDDALPQLEAVIAGLHSEQRVQVRNDLCGRDIPRRSGLAFNAAEDAAATARGRICR